MRVLLITDGIHPYVLGGMQKHSYYLAKFLSRSGVRVHVVHAAPPDVAGHEPDRPEFSGFDLANVSFQAIPFPAPARWPGHYLRANKEFSRMAFAHAEPHFQDFDLVYCQGFTGLAFVEARRKGQLAIPVLCNLHGYEMFQDPPDLRAALTRGPLRSLAQRLSRDADGIFSFGGKITDILVGMGVRPDRILECPIGIEEDWLVDHIPARDRRERAFIFVGRDERRKGIDELNQALQHLSSGGNTGFRMHFVGPIAERNRREMAGVVYHGAIRDEGKLKALLRSCDVLVCPSWSEGMPTVIMEAMASGLAVIATDVGAVRQQVGENGWLLPKPVPSAIRSALEAAMRSAPEELAAMKQRSLAKVRERFTWERVIQGKIGLLSRFMDHAHQR
jgi:glycosyltransferase involved in cell wall biosynthesis